jgi:transcriptional regulator with XRE-family HTH domain
LPQTRRVSSLEAFGPNLRRKRLRYGISLEELSFRTKVSVDLWDAMEKNDFSRWPTGISARAYIREYAEAIGVDPNATVDEFCRVVPHGDRRAERVVRETAELIGHQLVWSDDLPPTLIEGDRRAPAAQPNGSGGRWWTEANLRRLTAGLDLIVVVTLAGTMASALKVNFWATLSVTALSYHGGSLALLGCSPVVWAIDTYASTHLPVRPRGGVPVFRRLSLIRHDDPSPDRDHAA